MRFLLLLTLAIPTLAFAADPIRLKLRPSRGVQITCTAANAGQLTYSGPSEEFSIFRVGESFVSYEIYRNDYLLATCSSVTVDAQ